jgi:hypothetical protein
MDAVFIPTVVQPLVNDIQELATAAPRDYNYVNKRILAAKLDSILARFRDMVRIGNESVTLRTRTLAHPLLETFQKDYTELTALLKRLSPVTSTLFGDYACAAPDALLTVETGWSKSKEAIDHLGDEEKGGPAKRTLGIATFAVEAAAVRAAQLEAASKTAAETDTTPE